MSDSSDQAIQNYLSELLLDDAPKPVKTEREPLRPADQSDFGNALPKISGFSLKQTTPRPEMIKLDARRPETSRPVAIAVKTRLQSLLVPSLDLPNSESVVETHDSIEPTPQTVSVTVRKEIETGKPETELSEVVLESTAPEIAEVDDFVQTQHLEIKQNTGCEWLENGRPIWAQDDFDVLLFDVSGLTLAVPLICLGQIYPLTEELTPIFGQANWFMGLLPTPQGRIRVINTALYVMPERYREESIATLKYVVSLDGCNWGFAVDKVHQPTRLQLSQVTWRSARSKRPWLAGTVKSAMCALIDIPSLAAILQQSEDKTVS